MKKVLLSLVSISLLFASCQKEYIETKTETQNTLSLEQKKLKSNLDKAALLLSRVVISKDVKKELQTVFNSKADYHSISFKDIITSDNKSVNTRLPEFSNKVIEAFKSSKENGDLINYLTQNGCRIYIPYPLDWYSSEKPITVAGHPIDNSIEGPGYSGIDSKEITKVMVNEDYADSNPVMLVMPEMPVDEDGFGDDNGGGTGGSYSEPVYGEYGSGPNTLYTVYIGYVRLADYCGGIFESYRGVELRISRVEPYFNVNTNSVEASDPVFLSVNIPRKYIKAAKENWTQYCNGGWYPVNAVFDTDWKVNEDRQGIYAYDYDWDAKFQNIKIGVNFKDVGFNVSIEKNYQYKGDLIGKNDQWWRTWFFATNTNPTPSDEKYKGWTVRSFGSLKFTTPTYVLHY